jgi:hypothetical protein
MSERFAQDTTAALEIVPLYTPCTLLDGQPEVVSGHALVELEVWLEILRELHTACRFLDLYSKSFLLASSNAESCTVSPLGVLKSK